MITRIIVCLGLVLHHNQSECDALWGVRWAAARARITHTAVRSLQTWIFDEVKTMPTKADTHLPRMIHRDKRGATAVVNDGSAGVFWAKFSFAAPFGGPVRTLVTSEVHNRRFRSPRCWKILISYKYVMRVLLHMPTHSSLLD